MNPKEIAQLQAYLRNRFSNKNIIIIPRTNKKDSAEVMLNDEFLGVIFRDDEDDEICYQFNMTLLDIDINAF
ncbi:hypothetical protein A1OE_1045 [Candidatus Endolissoclinum faulkneri L2]|uniref:DUF3126 family protein n=1 Tax=Candidatus Endolissoclinum faulkneri L2 TaxID=1193729 RepID=K7Z595_9PROT|nr:DUF3126 family protein [Candidatus Endolissoclinum faulkneri]AFX99223.1 hypothetical protein A1OE_1045 [Candidatus Endolissoclinum faulkneri L2]